MAEASLRDRRIMVVEDEYMLADAMQQGLQKSGAIVLGPVPSVEEALELLEKEPDVDGAILDINLGGEKVFPFADALAARGVPFCSRPGTTLPTCRSPISTSGASRSRST